MKKLFLIYNPNAGKGAIKTKLAELIDIFAQAGFETTVYPTKKCKDAEERIAFLEESYELLVCGGGDGTLDEVVTGMMRRKEKLPIGYIPTGTTNDFASSLHIPKEIKKAAKLAVQGLPFSCDVGKMGQDTFVYIAAFGLFTDVSYGTKQEMKNMLGHLAYLLEGIKRLRNVPTYRVKVSSKELEIEEEFVYGMITNSSSVGGFRNIVGGKVVFDDGEFEVTLIKVPQNPIELQEIIRSLLIEEADTKHVYQFRASQVVLESLEAIPWTVDGEYGGEHKRVEIENVKCGIEIMVDPKEIKHLSGSVAITSGEKQEKEKE